MARFFGRVLPGRRTPVTAILFTTALAVILISTGDLGTLADTTVLLLLFVFTVVNVSALVLRRDQVDHEHFRSPAVFPVLGAGVSLALIADSAFDDLAVFARAWLLLLLGVILWAVNRRFATPHRAA